MIQTLKSDRFLTLTFRKDNDAGGFFVARFVKHVAAAKPSPKQGLADNLAMLDVADNHKLQQQEALATEQRGTIGGVSMVGGLKRRVRGDYFHRGSSVVELEQDDELWAQICDFYGIENKDSASSSGGLGIMGGCVLGNVRDEKMTTLCLVSQATQELFSCPSAMKHPAFRLVTVGMPLFTALSSKKSFLKTAICRWRPCREAALLLTLTLTLTLIGGLVGKLHYFSLEG